MYFVVANHSKGEFLDPFSFGEAPRLVELLLSNSGTLAGLALLLRVSPERGGGDWFGDNAPDNALELHPIVGSWAGDKVEIVGNYEDSSYWSVRDSYVDVSLKVLAALVRVPAVRRKVLDKIRWILDGTMTSAGFVSASECNAFNLMVEETPAWTGR